MFKGLYLQRNPARMAWPPKIQACCRAAAILLTASGGAFAQGVSQRPAAERDPLKRLQCYLVSHCLWSSHRTGFEEIRKWRQRRANSATEGQVLQDARPNPSSHTPWKTRVPKTRTQSWQLNLPVELGGKRAARPKAAEKSREQAQAQLAELKATVRAMSLQLTLMF